MAIQEFQGTINKIVQISKKIRHYYIDLDKEIEFLAGQFVNLSFEENGEKYMRAYSIASAPSNKKQIELCIKLVEKGKVTPKIFEKKEGDKVTIKGPFGFFTAEKAKKEKLVFIGTGTGIAPFRSIIKDLTERKIEKEITLIFGARYENTITFREEFEKLQEENPHFKYLVVISKPTEKWRGRLGHVQDNFDIIDTQNSEIYLCGQKLMVEDCINKLEAIGIPPEFIHHEKY